MKEGETHMRGIQQPYDLSLYSKRVCEFEILSPERERELARRYRQGDDEAGQIIINANLRMALRISRHYCRRGYDPMKIVLQGNMGLVEALEMFDPDKGIEFSRHAVWWMHKHIWDFIHTHSPEKHGYAVEASPSLLRRAIAVMGGSFARVIFLVISKAKGKALRPSGSRPPYPVFPIPAMGRLPAVKVMIRRAFT
jgi:hypothetical protein